MPKAIAVQAVFLIGVIAITLFFIAGIFWQWISSTKGIVSDAACRANYNSCCAALVNGIKKTCEWDSGCSQYNIDQPTLSACCSQEEFKLGKECNKLS